MYNEEPYAPHFLFTNDDWSLRKVKVKQQEVLVWTDRGVPSRKAFEEMVTQCREFYQLLTDEEIDELNEAIRNHKPNYAPAPKVKKDSSGYVYLIRSSSGHYKIGISKDPKKRKDQLANATGPYELEIVRQVKVGDAKSEESKLHKIFGRCRVAGEWFEFDDGEMETLIAIFDLMGKWHE